MNRTVYAIYGASGFGREVLPLAKEILQNRIDEAELVFIDDNRSEKMINGVVVYSFDEFLDLDCEDKYVCLAIANSQVRETLYKKIDENNIIHWSIQAQNTVLLDECVVGKNLILTPFTTITSNVKIGKAFHANLYSYVAHDCIIGDFVTFAPGVKCNGNVNIHDHVYIGTGAIIKQGKPTKPLVIGEGSTISAGAVVTKNVPPGITVFGNPAVPLTKENMKRMMR